MRSFLFKLLLPVSTLVDWIWSHKLRVVAYHDVKDAGIFEKQVVYLKSRYSVISLQDLMDYFELGAPLPHRALLITFDDGDISVYEKGLMVLKKYQLPAVLFIITELIASRKAFWWKRVEKDYTGRGLSFVEARQKVRALKEMPNAARVTFLSAVSDVDMRQLTYAELSELAANRISIANHSHTHPMFNYCTSTEINAEMEQSRSFFNVFQTGYFDVFAYPNGNFDKETEKALKKEGIRYAFLFDHKLNNMPVNPMRISRIRANADHDLSEFKIRVSGLHRMLARVK